MSNNGISHTLQNTLGNAQFLNHNVNEVTTINSSPIPWWEIKYHEQFAGYTLKASNGRLVALVDGDEVNLVAEPDVYDKTYFWKIQEISSGSGEYTITNVDQPLNAAIPFGAPPIPSENRVVPVAKGTVGNSQTWYITPPPPPPQVE